MMRNYLVLIIRQLDAQLLYLNRQIVGFVTFIERYLTVSNLKPLHYFEIII